MFVNTTKTFSNYCFVKLRSGFFPPLRHHPWYAQIHGLWRCLKDGSYLYRRQFLHFRTEIIFVACQIEQRKLFQKKVLPSFETIRIICCLHSGRDGSPKACQGSDRAGMECRGASRLYNVVVRLHFLRLGSSRKQGMLFLPSELEISKYKAAKSKCFTSGANSRSLCDFSLHPNVSTF